MQSMIQLGRVPRDEQCARPEDADFAIRSETEARVFLRQLRRSFPVMAGVPARLSVKCGLADGEGRAVVVMYDEGSAEACVYATSVAQNCPSRWDRVALEELKWFRNQRYYNDLVARGRIAVEAVPAIYRTVLPPDFAAAMKAGRELVGTEA